MEKTVNRQNLNSPETFLNHLDNLLKGKPQRKQRNQSSCKPVSFRGISSTYSGNNISHKQNLEISN
jgi:hypothetical protein